MEDHWNTRPTFHSKRGSRIERRNTIWITRQGGQVVLEVRGECNHVTASLSLNMAKRIGQKLIYESGEDEGAVLDWNKAKSA